MGSCPGSPSSSHGMAPVAGPFGLDAALCPGLRMGVLGSDQRLRSSGSAMLPGLEVSAAGPSPLQTNALLVTAVVRGLEVSWRTVLEVSWTVVGCNVRLCTTL